MTIVIETCNGRIKLQNTIYSIVVHKIFRNIKINTFEIEEAVEYAKQYISE
jgi:hypothetical protein